MTCELKAIVAVCDDWGIGRDGDMVVSNRADMRHFVNKTKGHPVIMGRKTLESFPGGRPLKDRRNIVLTRDEAFSREGVEVVHSVDEALAALNARFDWIDPSVFGHLGDGNLHFNIGSIPPNLAFENEEGIRETVYEVVSRHNGSISAEHGIGQLKRAHFLKLKDPLELELMGAIKRALDPKGILNPGKLLAD